MELWIRSQNKRELRPNPKLGIDEIKDKFYILDRFNFEEATILGTYKTEQRALEVLNEIQKKINLINLGHDFGSPMIDLKNPTYIYEMPEE